MSKFLIAHAKFFLRPGLRRTMKITRVDSIESIPYQRRIERGVRLFMFDADDTIAEYCAAQVPDRTQEVFRKLSEYPGVSVLVLSNASSTRRLELRQALSALKIWVAGGGRKPDPEVFSSVLKEFGAQPNQAVMIGDRVGTDLWGAHLAGIAKLFLVRPYSSVFGGRPIPLVVRWLRSLEKYLVRGQISEFLAREA